MFLTEDFFPEFYSGKKFPGRNFPTGIFSGSFSPSRAEIPLIFSLRWKKEFAHFTRRAKLPPFDIYTSYPVVVKSEKVK